MAPPPPCLSTYLVCVWPLIWYHFQSELIFERCCLFPANKIHLEVLFFKLHTYFIGVFHLSSIQLFITSVVSNNYHFYYNFFWEPLNYSIVNLYSTHFVKLCYCSIRALQSPRFAKCATVVRKFPLLKTP